MGYKYFVSFIVADCNKNKVPGRAIMHFSSKIENETHIVQIEDSIQEMNYRSVNVCITNFILLKEEDECI